MKEKIEALRQKYKDIHERQKLYFLDRSRPQMEAERRIEDKLQNDNIEDALEWNKWVIKCIHGIIPLKAEGEIIEEYYHDFIFAKYLRPYFFAVVDKSEPMLYGCMGNKWQQKYLSLPLIEDRSQIYDDLFAPPHEDEFVFELYETRWEEIQGKIYDIYTDEEIENKENFLIYLEQMIEKWEGKKSE